MTQKQNRFVSEYLIDCNGTQAAIRAGYSPKTAKAQAAAMMQNPEIKAAISDRLEAMSSAKIADAKEIMEYLTAVMRGEYTEEVLSLCGDGCQELVPKVVGAKDRIRAAELIGKRYGLFKDNVNLDVVPIVIVDDIPDDDG